MNCMLFRTPPPFEIPKGCSKFEHAKNVLKLKDKDTVFAGECNSDLYLCEASLSESKIILTPLKKLKNPQRQNISLIVAFTRPQIAKRILFESACFGVENLIFYAAQKSDSSYIKSSLYCKNEYFEHLLLGAEQACSTYLPNFYTEENLESAIEKINSLIPESEKYAPDLYEFTENLRNISVSKKHKVLLLGGERGFHNDERDFLRKNGFTLVSLGNRVLRTDSAVIASLSLLT